MRVLGKNLVEINDLISMETKVPEYGKLLKILKCLLKTDGKNLNRSSNTKDLEHIAEIRNRKRKEGIIPGKKDFI